MTRILRRTLTPLIAAAAAWSTAQAAEVNDHAGMFSPKVVQAAQEELTRAERATGVPIVIETIDAIPGLAPDASHDAKMKAVNTLAAKRGRELGGEGIYLLLSKNDKVFSNVLVGERYAGALSGANRRAIGEALVSSFKAGDFDGGLTNAADALVAALPDGPVAARGRQAGQPVAARPAQRHGVGSLLTIGLGILAVLFVVRLLSGLFGGGAGAGYPHAMGGMPRPGMGPGYGGPGYGGYGYGGRGGFFSSLMGGIGGAMAGNWLYDQFSGRHSQGHADASNYNADFGNGDGLTGVDGDYGGGDWGDSGGGDWGGGGGDWGGGGGDWGGGDGGSW